MENDSFFQLIILFNFSFDNSKRLSKNENNRLFLIFGWFYWLSIYFSARRVRYCSASCTFVAHSLARGLPVICASLAHWQNKQFIDAFLVSEKWMLNRPTDCCCFALAGMSVWESFKWLITRGSSAFVLRNRQIASRNEFAFIEANRLQMWMPAVAQTQIERTNVIIQA